MSQTIQIVKTHPEAKIPEYATSGSAGFDLCILTEFSQPFILCPGNTHLFDTGLKMAVPEGYELQIRSRSGMAKKGVVVVNSPGTIDSDYRGHIKVMLRNIESEKYILRSGDRVAQAVLAPVIQAHFNLVDSLDETARGQGGFGSTGTN